ncbi:hypothetical protein EI94DRAFT_1739018 [Lactarius quietus]|nr:hypothetical protein EI94DRAFT_1739018 [Lactarius quietus]
MLHGTTNTIPMDPPVLPSLPNEVAENETLHFDYPGADIVLRSFDSHDFRVPKLYITNCSPVLRRLIALIMSTSDVPKDELEGPEPLPVIKLPENGAALYSLLTLIFPVLPILPSTSEKLIELLGVAQKYEMDSILSHIRGIIARKDPPFIRPETAFHIYFLAQEYELHQEVIQAARATLRLPMIIEDLGDKLDFPGMTGVYLHELWKYHQRFRTDLKSCVLESRNSGLLAHHMRSLRCNYADYDPHQFRWVDDYLDSIAKAPHVIDLIEFENTWARHIKDSRAHSPSRSPCSCLEFSGQLRRTFWEALTAVVHETIEKADLSLALVKEDQTSENSDPPSVPLYLDIPDADLILRSSDQVAFRVRKSLLAMASPFFEQLLSLPQPLDAELVDGLQVVELPEDADLLNSLVSLLYPISPVIPGSYKKVFALLAACQKYDMVRIQFNIRTETQRGIFPAPVEAEAFSAYVRASSLRLIPEMENAAKLTMGQPMTFESLGEGLRQFKGSALCELVRYRVAKN